MIAFAAAHTLLGVGGESMDAPIRDWLSSAAYVIVAAIVTARAVMIRVARRAWAAFALGLWLYAAGNLLWSLWLQNTPDPPIPSVCDALWLALYPCCYVGIGLLMRAHSKRVSAGVALDGLIAALGITAVGAAVVFRPIIDAATGDALAVATNLAYPIVDLVLAALVVGVLGVRGWRVGWTWGLLGSGFLVLCVADFIYLLQVAAGTSEASTVANLFYMSALLLIALAAWQPALPATVPRVEGWSMLLVPAAFIAAALGLITYGYEHRLDPIAFSLAMLTVVMSVARTALTFREVRALADTRTQAVTDDLTGLPNRRLFRRRLEEAIATARAGNDSVALLVIDLDRFKELNDTLGHHAGDILLSQIGPRIHESLRAHDTVARLGGDEFAVVLPHVGSAEAALAVTDKVLAAIARPFVVEEMSLRVGASIGVTLWPEHASDGDELLRRADVAMYEAKTMRTGRELYARDRDTHSRNRLALVADFDTALRAGEIEVHFQPIARTFDHAVVAVEALARWHHPLQGPVPPDEFVAIAEQAGLARMLTGHVLERALAQCAVWRRSVEDLHVSVNVTPADLHDACLPHEIAAALARHGLPNNALVLEITERSVLTDPHRTGNVLARIDDMGICLSLDDFGTGYSSLTHLKSLPVSEVKIDRSFVAKMASDRDDAAIVRATIGLAHSLGKTVVAEGVEDAHTWELLSALGCELIQGYVIARPAAAGALEELLPELRATRV